MEKAAIHASGMKGVTILAKFLEGNMLLAAPF
jgi:hypothetical protein